MIKEKRDLLLIDRYRKAGYVVKLVQLCPHCGGEISAVIGTKKKRKGVK
jgi:hypothetical protein